jgi:dTDP-4-amino-4,6-dideoxygalactose transaminase
MIPVHMWGQVCDMDALMAVAGRHELLVVEDACQCVGGAYGDHPVGSIGQAGAMSFNYFKNMTCGEGGAVVTDDGDVIRRARCFIDPCAFFWEGSEEEFQPFSNAGARASEIQGAMLNAQLDRLPGLIETLRGHKAYLIGEIQSAGLTLSPRHSPAGECATALMLLLPSPEAAESFASATGGTLLARTGRHTYTEWTCVLERRGAHHPDLDPFKLPQNRDCRMAYSRDLCPRSLEILHRTVSIGLSVHQSRADLDRLAATIREAAATVGA